MDIVKLDCYEYEILDVRNSEGRAVMTLLYITVDSTIDPSIFDITNALSISNNVHVDGRYFTCKDYEIKEHDPIRGGPVLELYLKENAITREAV